MIYHVSLTFTSCTPEMKLLVHIKNMTTGSACSSMPAPKHCTLIMVVNSLENILCSIWSPKVLHKNVPSMTLHRKMVWPNAAITPLWSKSMPDCMQAAFQGFLWGETVCHVVWLMNQTLTKAVNGETPYEAELGSKPNLKHVQEWGEGMGAHWWRGQVRRMYDRRMLGRHQQEAKTSRSTGPTNRLSLWNEMCTLTMG